jgi:hypothetical protein
MADCALRAAVLVAGNWTAVEAIWPVVARVPGDDSSTWVKSTGISF